MLKYTPYSAYKFKVFDECRKKFSYQYIEKIKVFFVPSPAIEKGKFFHALLAEWPNISLKEFKFTVSSPLDVERYKREFDKILENEKLRELLSLPSERERKISIFDNYQKLIIGFVDFIYLKDDEAFIIDWKTGKTTYNQDQLMLYALWMFHSGDKTTNKVNSTYYYLDLGKTKTYYYLRDHVGKMWDHFNEKINTIEIETRFLKTPSDRCRYCDFFNTCKPYNISTR